MNAIHYTKPDEPASTNKLLFEDSRHEVDAQGLQSQKANIYIIPLPNDLEERHY